MIYIFFVLSDVSLRYVTDTGSAGFEIAACFLVSGVEFPNESGLGRF